jgi:quercetin dioxygenase-like cupin family protein
MSYSINDIGLMDFTQTAHAAGKKKVLFGSQGVVTQFAYGRIGQHEEIPAHHHETMDEYFYFLKGTGSYKIAGEVVALHPGIAVFISAGVSHGLLADTDLEFVYFGIATTVP